MSEWKTVRLEQLGQIVGGGTPSTKNPDYYGGDVPWITPKDLSNYNSVYISSGERNITQEGLNGSGAQMLPRGSILFSSRAPIGYVAIAINPLCTNQGFKSIVPNESLDSTFGYYLLRYNKDRIEAMASGTTFKEVSGSVMKSVEVTIPSFPTQRRIAAVLGALDDKIENNRKICENLEAQAQALFKSWFVDFEPWGGKMPEGWKMGKLGELAEVTSGKRPPSRSNVKDETTPYPLLGASTIMGFTSQYLYDTPILVTGRVGTHGVIQRSCCPAWPSDNTLVLTSEFYEYVYQLLLRVDYAKMNCGSTQPLITQTDLKNVEVVFPTDDCLVRYEKQAGVLMAMCNEKRLESRALAEMRDALLPKLMSGRLRVDATACQGEIDVEKVEI